MATTTGTATSYHDLLDKLRIYLVAQGWTQKAWSAPGSITAVASLQMMAPGSGTGREIYVNIKTQADATSGFYSWRVRGATGYTAGAAEGANPGELQSDVYFNLWQNSITYWFYVSDRRFIVVAKCSTAYISLYAGLFLPFGTPTQYPFPLFIGADYGKQCSWSQVNSARRMFCDPGGDLPSGLDSNAYYRTPGGTWQGIVNHDASANNDYGQSFTTGQARMWPYSGDHFVSTNSTYYEFGASLAGAASGRALDNFVTTRQGERWLWPVQIIKADEAPPGVLEGVFCVPGVGMAAEQVITAGGAAHKAFQNISRASGNDFFVIKEG